MKLNEILKKYITLLKNNNFETAVLDTKLLISYILGININNLIFDINKDINEKQLLLIEKVFTRRLNHEPISKIINKKQFWDYYFYVDNNVLDPRPDSENMIELILEDYDKNECLNILDLGSGSGCLILTLLKIFKNSKGVAVDISDKSLEIIKKNAKLLNISNVDIIKSYWNKEIHSKFDIIISNPPYIKTKEINSLQIEVKEFEPLIALDGGSDGLDCYKYISKNIKKNCTKNTKIYLESGFNQKNDIINIFTQNDFKLFKIKKDLQKYDRIISFVI